MAQSFVVYLGDVYSTESIQAGTATVSATYTLADWLSPTHLSIGTNGEIGEARIIGHKHPDIAAPLVSIHQAIQIKEAGEDGSMIFQGVVVKKHLSSSGDGETFELVCYNSGDYLLYRIALHGQYRRGHPLEQAMYTAGPADGAQGISLGQLVLIDTPLYFNPDGAPNRSQEQYFNSDDPGSNTISIFDAPDRHQVNNGGDIIKSVPWTLKDAVTYLLNLYPVSWAIDPASFTDAAMGTFDTNGNPTISNVNLESKPLSVALKELLEPYNYGYWIDPVPTGSPSLFKIKFFFRGAGEEVQVTLPERDSADISDANVIHYDLLYDACAVVNCVTGVGDAKIITTLAHTAPPSGGTPCLKLVPAWAHADLVFVPDDNDAGRINPYAKQFRKDYTHPDLLTTIGADDAAHTAYGVGRLWMVNLGEVPTENLEDLKLDLADGGATECSIDPRRFEKPEFYTTASSGGVIQQEDVQVEMSFDTGVHWNIVDKSFYKVLSDGMGIVFIEPRLERLGTKFDHADGVPRSTYWQCLYDMLYADSLTANKLQIRVLCAVKSDEHLVRTRPNFGDSVPLAIERVFDNPGYKKNAFNAHAYDSLYFTKFPPHQQDQDDSDALQTVVTQQTTQSDRLLVSGKVVVVMAEFDQYKPGQQLTSIVNRFDLDPSPTIVRVVYDLSANHVELILDSHRVASILRNKPLDSAQAARKFGAEHSSPIPSGAGHQVPYLPGNSKDRQFYRRTGGAGDDGDSAE